LRLKVIYEIRLNIEEFDVIFLSINLSMQFKNYCRNIFLLTVFVFITSKSESQVIIALLFGEKLNSGKLEFGLTGGWTISNISSLPESKSKNAFNLGLYFDIKLSDKWYIHPEAVPKYPTGVTKLKPYSLGNEGLDSLLKGGNVTRKIKNIIVPLLIRYRIKNQFFVEAGPQIGLRTKGNDVFTNGSLTYEHNIEENLTRFDFGFAFGFAQRLSKNPQGMSLVFRYYYGFIDTDKTTAGSQKNSVLQINARIAVGTGKKKKKEAIIE
jgi:hypothetical protein